jgi:polyisoprenoid-binding protein YceI
MAKDPYGHDRVGLSMAATIRRSDFSIVFDPSGALVGNNVAIEIDLSLVRQPDYLRVAEALGRSVSG